MRGQKLIDGASVKHLITKYFQNVHFFLQQFFRIEALQVLFSFFSILNNESRKSSQKTEINFIVNGYTCTNFLVLNKK